MPNILRKLHDAREHRAYLIVLFLVLLASQALAASPWEDAVNNLERAMTGPIARGLSLVAIVVGGLMFAYGESGSKKMLAGIIFGLGMALLAPSFKSWLFPAAG